MIFCVEDETGFCDGIDPACDSLLMRIGEEALREEQIEETAPFETELLIVGDGEIREMNRENRGIDRVTDVLSFPNIDLSEEKAEDAIRSQAADITDPGTGHIMLGSIVINRNRVISQAEEYGHSRKREFAFLVAHSLFHLLGYDHETPAEAARMEEKQERVLKNLGITRDPDTVQSEAGYGTGSVRPKPDDRVPLSGERMNS